MLGFLKSQINPNEIFREMPIRYFFYISDLHIFLI
nr:MAG TPA: hypothetical protein [Caudoviricetes sp.]